MFWEFLSLSKNWRRKDKNFSQKSRIVLTDWLHIRNLLFWTIQDPSNKNDLKILQFTPTEIMYMQEFTSLMLRSWKNPS